MSRESSIGDLTMEDVLDDEEDCNEGFHSQIKELQEAISGMKMAFTQAQIQLESVQKEDDENRQDMKKCQQQSAEILRLMLSLKSEVSELKETVDSTQSMQHALQSTIQSLVIERDLLLEELAKNGSVSQNTRNRLHSDFHHNLWRPSSGSQSTNDSGVALLLEKAHAAFQTRHLATSSGHGSSNNGSQHHGSNNDDEPISPMLYGSQSSEFRDHETYIHDHLVSPNHVQAYLNGLNNNAAMEGQPRAFQMHANDGETRSACNGAYDSDSSLTLAAAKSLSLSNSLSKQCGLELDQEEKSHSNLNNRICRTNRSHHCHNDIQIDKSQDYSHHERPEDRESSYNQSLSRKKETSGMGELDGDEELDERARNLKNNGNGNHGINLNCKESQRQRVVQELVETEKKYCKTLKTIQETFAKPLRTTGILNMKDINTLFPEEVFILYEKHCGLLTELEERIASWEHQPIIGDLLERFTNAEGSDVLRLYTNYVNDFPELLKTFHKLCRSSSEFTGFLKACLDEPTCGGLDLGAFLLTPVQRMPRYILLLKQILKHTESGHVDYKNITICLERLRNYLRRLNDSMEHSFQLVTAQITPAAHETNNDNFSTPNEHGRLINFSRSSKNRFARASSSSRSSSGSFVDRNNDRKGPHKRSTSVPRNDATDYCKIVTPNKLKLKSRSKSDWAVCRKKSAEGNVNDHSGCNACSCGRPMSGTAAYNSTIYASSVSVCPSPPAAQGTMTFKDQKETAVRSGRIIHHALSDSDLNSDNEEVDNPQRKYDDRRCPYPPVSKSLHDFKQEEEWNLSEPNLINETGIKSTEFDHRDDEFNQRGGTIVRNNMLVRPLSSKMLQNQQKTTTTRYIAKIQRGSGSDFDINDMTKYGGTDGGLAKTHKKRSSLKSSLKNLFSIKKRSSKGIEISRPINSSGVSDSKKPTVGDNFSNSKSSFPNKQKSEIDFNKVSKLEVCKATRRPGDYQAKEESFSNVEANEGNKTCAVTHVSLPHAPNNFLRVHNKKSLSNPKLPLRSALMHRYSASIQQYYDDRGKPYTDV